MEGKRSAFGGRHSRRGAAAKLGVRGKKIPLRMEGEKRQVCRLH